MCAKQEDLFGRTFDQQLEIAGVGIESMVSVE